MSYVRSKMINGYGPYYYEVESVREGDKVEQRYIAYLGKNPGSKSQSHSDKLGTTEPTREPLKEEPKKEEEKLKTDEPKPETKEEKDLGTTEETPYEHRLKENDQKYLDKSSPEYKDGYKDGVGEYYQNDAAKRDNKPHSTYERQMNDAKNGIDQSARYGSDAPNKVTWNEKRGYSDGIQAAHNGNGPEYGTIKFRDGDRKVVDKKGHYYKLYRYRDGDAFFKDDKKIKMDG